MKINVRELWECASRELSRRKSRTMANIAAYLIAVCVLLVFLTFMRASRDFNRSILGSVGTHFLVYMPWESGAKEYFIPKAPTGEGFFAAGVFSDPFSPNIVKQIASIKEVKDASPYISYRMQGREDRQFFLIGGFDPASPVSVNSTTCAPADLVAGRFLEPGDKGKNVFIAEQNYSSVRGYSVGDRIRILGEEFELVGIVKPATRPARADIYMDIETATRLIVNRMPANVAAGNTINGVLVESKEGPVQDTAISKIRMLSTKLEIYGFGCYKPASNSISVSEQTFWFLTLLIMIAAILFSMKTQLSSVMERQHDIGILKAIGWSNRAITWQILLESLVQSLIGCVFGCAVAVFIVTLVPLRLVVGQPLLRGTTIPAFLFLLAVLISAGGGMLAGIVPALNAARKYPAEALRHI